ncbi:hypothetical protein [Nonomuraea sp. GTA35]|uniref:hypothetical protein n=1 Tax=Nonomuraea sp. GTA35 TaxID=1676746 RepID=UPI0035BF84BA
MYERADSIRPLHERADSVRPLYERADSVRPRRSRERAADQPWAQSLRMARIPAPLRGRGSALLRTLMQATPPLGAVIVTPFLAAGALAPPVLIMTLIAAAPAPALLAMA